MRRLSLAFVLIVALASPAQGTDTAEWVTSVIDGSATPEAALSLVDDAEVLALLSDEERPMVERWGAVRVSVALDEPTLALPSLATLAASYDSRVAPDAAYAAYQIAQQLDPVELDAMEINREPLRELAPAYVAIASNETARADIRQLSGWVASALSAL